MVISRDEDPEFFFTDPDPDPAQLKKIPNPDPAGQKSPDPDPHPCKNLKATDKLTFLIIDGYKNIPTVH